MNRYNMCMDGDVTSLSDVYSSIYKPQVTINESANIIEEDIDFSKVKYIKVYEDGAAGGANLKYKGKVSSIGSDDGCGGVVLTAKDGKKQIDICSSGGSLQVTVIDSSGHEEYSFTTTIQPIHDVEEEELRIINNVISLA